MDNPTPDLIVPDAPHSTAAPATDLPPLTLEEERVALSAAIECHKVYLDDPVTFADELAADKEEDPNFLMNAEARLKEIESQIAKGAK